MELTRIGEFGGSPDVWSTHTAYNKLLAGILWRELGERERGRERGKARDTEMMKAFPSRPMPTRRSQNGRTKCGTWYRWDRGVVLVKAMSGAVGGVHTFIRPFLHKFLQPAIKVHQTPGKFHQLSSNSIKSQFSANLIKPHQIPSNSKFHQNSCKSVHTLFHSSPVIHSSADPH